MGARRWVGLVGILGALAAPQAAAATTYCVADPACPTDGEAKASVYQAIQAAEADDVLDTIRIGPGDFAAVGAETFYSSKPVRVSGAGREATRLTSVQPELMRLMHPDSSVTDLTLQITDEGQLGLRLAGASAARMGVSAPHEFTDATGIFAEDDGSLIREVVVDLGTAPTQHAVLNAGQNEVVASTLTGGIGIDGGATGGAPLTARRLTIHATIGARVYGDSLNISDSLITPHPAGNAFFIGAEADSGNPDPTSPQGTLLATNLTIIGDGGQFSTGVQGEDTNGGGSNASVNSSIVANVSSSFRRNGGAGKVIAMSVFNSSYDASTIADAGGGTGNVAQGAGNLPTAPDSRFLDPAAGDYRLRNDSPLIDVGASAAPQSLLDLGGGDRLRDGDGDGNARRDIGAHEYQRLPPAVAFSASSPAFFDQPVAFDGSQTVDPDGEGIASFSWSLGDGFVASGPIAAQTYGSPGARDVQLSATDVSGLTATATQQVDVGLHPGRCANRRKGGPRADRIVGFGAGDRLLGGRGNDRLLGGDGDDCLHGEGGRDRLSGGRGRDRLLGGPRRDRIATGGGRNVVKAGPGADSIRSRNGKRDRIDCGKGHDVVRADARDRLRRCERVRRG